MIPVYDSFVSWILFVFALQLLLTSRCCTASVSKYCKSSVSLCRLCFVFLLIQKQIYSSVLQVSRCTRSFFPSAYITLLLPYTFSFYVFSIYHFFLMNAFIDCWFTAHDTPALVHSSSQSTFSFRWEDKGNIDHGFSYIASRRIHLIRPLPLLNHHCLNPSEVECTATCRRVTEL